MDGACCEERREKGGRKEMGEEKVERKRELSCEKF